MNSQSDQQWELRIYGVVQGVNMRSMIRQKAIALGVTGFARNCSDGSVYVAAQAEEKMLRHFIHWLETSPGSSEVTRIDHAELSKKGTFDRFEITY